MTTYSSVLTALSDPTRQAIVDALRAGPLSVGELTARLPVSQPAVSQHLKVLREAELVDLQREGARRIYSLSMRGLAELRRYVESFWDDVLTAFAESTPTKETRDE